MAEEVSGTGQLTPPDLLYRPTDPRTCEFHIGLIGCGNITEYHLEAYSAAGYDVAAFCDNIEEAATERRDEYYPSASVYTDPEDVFHCDDIDIVDIATPPEPREALIEDAIRAGKHVLSQKPFVTDLDVGERLVELADDHGVKLAVNQNGRWAPHWSYMRNAVKEGLLGDIYYLDFSKHFDLDWISETRFDEISHALLYEFAIHWFDIVSSLIPGREVNDVSADIKQSPWQDSTPPLLGRVRIDFDGGQVSMAFNGDVQYGPHDRTVVAAESATIKSDGLDLNDQTVTVYDGDGAVTPDLEGAWFTDGFHGTMGELMCAIEEDYEPANSGRNNIRTLELCFAAMASADEGTAIMPGEVRRAPQ